MSERVAPLDANFFRMDTETTQQVIASYSPLDLLPDLNRARESILREIQSFPRLRQRISDNGGLRWTEDAHFDINRHLRFDHVPEARTQTDLIARAEQLFSMRLDLAHPPWEFVILTNRLESSSLSGLFFRVHHGLADGLGALEFFHRVCDLKRNESDEQEPPKRSHRHSGQTGAGPKAGSWHLMNSLRRLFAEAREPAEKSPLNGENSPLRKFAFIEFPMGDLKVLRRKYRSSLNDLMLALVTSAARRYQLSVNFSPVMLKALVPFNLRGRGDLTSLGNRLTGVGVSLPSSIADPVARLRAIQACFNRIKNDGSFGAYRIMGVLNGFMPRGLQRRFGEAAARRSNFICTNMPGPEKPLYFGGAKLLGQYGFAALLKQQGIAFAFMSYAGQACISVVSDPAVVPNPWQFIDYIKEAFDELAESAGDAGAPRVMSAS